jgi:hypothetical protein
LITGANWKRGQVLRGYKSIVCGAIALGLAACSMPKLPSLGGPPEQPQDVSCETLNTERVRLLAERDDLNKPQLSSRTDAEREAALRQLNGKLYTVAKAQSDKSCPAVATALPSSVVRLLGRSR